MKNSKFDKMRCIANIYMLAKQKNIKIGELESTAGVSAGYLSRLNKEDNTASPSVECLAAMAAELDISLDVLISAELTKLTPTEEYILNFIKKLLHDTEEDKLVWVKETKQKLDELDVYNGYHPLFSQAVRYDTEDGTVRSYDIMEYNPVERSDISTIINGNCFHAPIYGYAEVYLTNIRFENQNNNENDFDIFLVNGRNVKAVCSTRTVKSELSSLITNLYLSVSNSMYRLHLDEDIKNIIDGYVDNKPFSPEKDDIPF